jgi:hypothetical protein
MPARLCFTGGPTYYSPSLAGWPMVPNPAGWLMGLLTCIALAGPSSPVPPLQAS